jgi:fibronectin-binding autotransporter adhesin
LGNTNLKIGSNNLNTTFSGLLRGNSGSITKTGNGTLTLSGMNSYGSTTVQSGTLLVTNTAGSATGTKPVQVNAGTLGGSGIIGSAVIIGTASGSSGFLAPSAEVKMPTTLTIQSTLTLNPAATYTCRFKARRNTVMSDNVIANGVTINGGADINLRGSIQGTLTQGLTLTVITNTSANPVSGTFGNLPDGGTITIGGNKFQANYEGGDGNDLTLTVVP